MKKSDMLRKLMAVTVSMLILAGGGFFIVSAQQAENQNEKIANEERQNEYDVSETGWRIKDFRPYVTAISELQKLNKEYSESLLKLAVDEYSTGLDILEDMESEILKTRQVNKTKKHLNERYYWQEIDRKNAEERQMYTMSRQAKMRAVTYFIRAIKTIDDIQSEEVRQEPKFLNFKSRLYQVYVSTQYDLGNLRACIPILERYVTLTEESKNDVWAYKYMASSYGYVERTLQKARNVPESEILRYRGLKNRSLLQAVELSYGVDSPHYRQLQEMVELDERKTERINDFK